MNKKKLMYILTEWVSNIFIHSWIHSIDGDIQDKKVIFIVPSKSKDQMEKYREYLLQNGIDKIVIDNMLSIDFLNSSRLLNVFQILFDKILGYSDKNYSVLSFLILKFQILEDLIKILTDKKYKIVILNTNKNSKFIAKLKKLNIELINL